MLKRENLLLSYFIIVAQEILFFAWQPYYKGIFNIQILSSGGVCDKVIFVFYNILYYISVFIIAYYVLKSVLMADNTFKHAIAIIASLIGVRLLFDLTSLLLYYSVTKLRFMFLQNLFEIIFLNIQYCFTAQWLLSSNDRMKTNKLKPFLVTFTMSFLLLIIVSAINIFQHNQIAFLLKKYDSDVSWINYALMDFEYDYQLMSLLLYILVQFVLVTVFYFGSERLVLKEVQTHIHIQKSIIRFFSVVVVALIFYFIKMPVYQNILVTQENVVSETIDGDGLYTNRRDNGIYRGTFDKRDILVHYEEHADVYYNDDLICTVSGYTAREEWEFSVNDCILVIDCANDKMIVVLQGDIVSTYSLTNIDALKTRDEGLIKVLEKGIILGDWDCFEYGYKYLLQYDRDFICPYIEQAKSGDFSFVEQGLVKKTYMENFSKHIQA